MNIDHLRLFIVVARSGSLTEGARQSGMSQSAASQAIAQIESGLQVALFDRSRRPLGLTAAGIRFKAGVEPILDGWDRTVAGIRPTGESLSGSVTVAAIHSLGLHLLVGLAQRFAARHPGVRLHTQHLHHDLVLQAVCERRADLGIISFPPHLRSIEAIHLRDEPLLVVCHPSHRLVPRRRLVLADLDGQRMAAFDRGLPIREAIDAALRKAGVRVEVTMELDNIESLKQAVLSNCGIAILPEPMVLRETLGRLLVALPIEDVRLFRPIAAIRHRGHHDPATDAFIAFLRESTEQAQHAAPVAPVRYGQTPSQWE